MVRGPQDDPVGIAVWLGGAGPLVEIAVADQLETPVASGPTALRFRRRSVGGNPVGARSRNRVGASVVVGGPRGDSRRERKGELVEELSVRSDEVEGHRSRGVIGLDAAGQVTLRGPEPFLRRSSPLSAAARTFGSSSASAALRCFRHASAPRMPL